MGSPLESTIVNDFFVIMKKFVFNIVLLNLNLLSVEDMLMIHSYFFARNITTKNSEII